MGCLTSMSVAAILLLIVLVVGLFSSSTGTPKSTVQREKLETVGGFNGDCIVDELGWISNESQVKKAMKYFCIYRIKLAISTEKFRQVAGGNPPPRRKGPPVIGSASRKGWQSVGSVIVVGNRDAILSQNSLQHLSAFQIKV